MQDLINESIRMYGIDVYYLPRQYITEKTIIKEVIESQFTFASPIEAYVDSYDGYGGQGTILSKFGIQELDDLRIIISQERFNNYLAPLIEKIPNNKLSTRPKEGDLIYFPLGDRLFEIKYVEHEKPFYQLQKNYVYELTCELFRYEDEVVDTNIDFIDDNIKDAGYIQILQMANNISIEWQSILSTKASSQADAGSKIVCLNSTEGIQVGDYLTSGKNVRIKIVGFSSQNCVILDYGLLKTIRAGDIVNIERMITNNNPNASATATVVNGGVRYINIKNRGTGYTSAPKIVFSQAPPGGVTAIATAFMIQGIVDLCESDPSLLRVQQIQIINAGAGYTVAPKITFVGGGGSGAKAEAVLGNGIIGIVSITNSGFGYVHPPSVSFGGTHISGAGATSVLSNSGSVNSVRVINGGLGYGSTSTTVNIGSPSVLVGVGTYRYNEVVTGSTSNIQARVRFWDPQTKILKVSNMTGSFIVGESIIGSQSNADYTLSSINIENPPEPLSKVDTRDKYAENDDIEKEADEILDFSERNPFGTP